MSDLCIYKLEDNVWDEFSASDDHMVPRPGDEYEYQFEFHDDSQKKSRHELNNLGIISDDTVRYKTPGKEETSLPTLTKDTMIEKGPWSLAPDGVLPTSCDGNSVKEVTCITSGETRISSPSLKSGNFDVVATELCTDDLMDENCATADDNAYSYSLSNISQTSNDLSFFDNNHEDKEGNDLLYYGWPDDIGNFEDVDRMFRSCDSTFGLGSLSNDDNLCWFSSSLSPEGSKDAMQLASKFSSSEACALKSVSDGHEASRLNSMGLLASDSNNKLFIGDTTSSRTTSAVDHSSLSHLTFSNGSETESVSKDGFLLNKKINSHKKQARHKKQSEGKRVNRNLENSVSFCHNGNLKNFADKKHPTNSPYMHVDSSCTQDQVSVSCLQSAVKSESNGHTSSSPRESSYASNQGPSMESSHSPALNVPDVAMAENEECLDRCQKFHSSNSKLANLASPTAICDPISVQNQTYEPEYDIEDPSEIDGICIGVPSEIDLSNAQESSCMSSALDEISLEATSFRQLQQVMEQLDGRTKLCIRDSLYRLARSAEQRHNFGASGGYKRDDNGALASEETNRSTGFMDVETDTNPIDRSIAHLLFHRPADPLEVAANDAFSLKANAMGPASITSPPVMTKQLVSQEGIATVAEEKFVNE